MKVWDKREFKNYDDSVELGTRNIKVAMKRLRKWARKGAPDELDLDQTIRNTARKGYLDIEMRPEKRNTVSVLLLLDVGGSMDPCADHGGAVLGGKVGDQEPRILLFPQLPV
ncbi:MAG: hypothetical protein R3C00_05160 [Hyphomonas sp.]